MSKNLIGAFLAIAALVGLATSSAMAGGGFNRGEFQGASGHETSGTVTIEQTEEGFVVVLQDNFKFDGAPDPKLGFGKDGTYDASSKIAHLGKYEGRQVYPIPASVDVTAYNEFYVWCEKYSVPLGVAKLQ